MRPGTRLVKPMLVGTRKGGLFDTLVPLKNQINRLRHKVNAQQKPNSFRQKRTRTLIQCGGLLDKAGILQGFQISLGDDLQDFESLDTAATLLGFLKDKMDATNPSPKDLHSWKTIGQALLHKK